jgi:O-antigen ligase
VGAGYRSFRQIFPYSELAAGNNELTVRETSRVAHNVYLETLTGTGLIGLSAFVGMLFVTWRAFRRARSLSEPGSSMWAAASGLEYALIGYMVSSMFISSEQDKYIWILVGLSSGLLFCARSYAAARTSKNVPAVSNQPAVEPRWLTD